MKKDKLLYLKLLFSTFTLSAFTFGGGYVIVPLMQKRFVKEFKWIDEDEMLDLVAISQSAPGPLAINASILVGYRMAGIPGALLTAFGTVLPPLITITIISFFYIAFRDNQIVKGLMKGMQAGVAAIIVDVVITMTAKIIKNKRVLPIIVMVLSFITTTLLDVNIVIILLISGTLGAYTVFRSKHISENGTVKAAGLGKSTAPGKTADLERSSTLGNSASPGSITEVDSGRQEGSD